MHGAHYVDPLHKEICSNSKILECKPVQLWMRLCIAFFCIGTTISAREGFQSGIFVKTKTCFSVIRVATWECPTASSTGDNAWEYSLSSGYFLPLPGFWQSHWSESLNEILFCSFLIMTDMKRLFIYLSEICIFILLHSYSFFFYYGSFS